VAAGDALEREAAGWRWEGEGDQASIPVRVDAVGASRSRPPLSCSLVALATQAYSRRPRRLSPSLANRLRIGFAIASPLLPARAVIGVGRFIQQRQDFEDAIARSYQVAIGGAGAGGA